MNIFKNFKESTLTFPQKIRFSIYCLGIAHKNKQRKCIAHIILENNHIHL